MQDDRISKVLAEIDEEAVELNRVRIDEIPIALRSPLQNLLPRRVQHRNKRKRKNVYSKKLLQHVSVTNKKQQQQQQQPPQQHQL